MTRTLYREDSLEGKQLLSGKGAMSYKAITASNKGTGFMNPTALPWAIGMAAGDAVETAGDGIQFITKLIGQAIGPSADAEEWIEGLPQYSFECDLDGRAWDPIFNPHVEDGLKTSSISATFWVSLIAAKFAPGLAKTGFNVAKTLYKVRKNSKMRAWRNHLDDGVSELLARTDVVGFDERVGNVPKSIDLLTQLSRGVATNSSHYRSKILEHAEIIDGVDVN